MAMKKSYYTVDGQMIGYKTAAGRKDFLTDALGSVTAEVDQTGATKTFDGRYKPYGGDLSATGSSGSYGWVGSWGYRGTGLSASSHYVRARHYSRLSGAWCTIDTQWPGEDAYSYVNGRSIAKLDPSGTNPNFVNCPNAVDLEKFRKQLETKMKPFCKPNGTDIAPTKALVACFSGAGDNQPDKEAQCLCKHIYGVFPVKFSCSTDPGECKDNKYGCKGDCMCTAKGGSRSDCSVTICQHQCNSTGSDWDQRFLHEMMHCCGVVHWPKSVPKGESDPDKLEDCLRTLLGLPIYDKGRGPWPGWTAIDHPPSPGNPCPR